VGDADGAGHEPQTGNDIRHHGVRHLDIRDHDGRHGRRRGVPARRRLSFAQREQADPDQVVHQLCDFRQLSLHGLGERHEVTLAVHAGEDFPLRGRQPQ
jgi:hypothetical protein